MISHFLTILPSYALTVLGVVIFGLVMLEWYLGVRRGKRKADALHEIELKAINEAKEKEIDEIRTEELSTRKYLRKEHDEEIKKLQDSKTVILEELNRQITDLHQQATAYAWLTELASIQANTISDYLLYKGMFYARHQFTDAVPYILVCIRVYNVSVFDLTFTNEITGDIYFLGKELRCTVGFAENPNPTVKKGEWMDFCIDIQFGEIEVEAMRNAVKAYKTNSSSQIPALGFSGLRFFVVGDGFDQVKRTPWPLKQKRVDALKLNEIDNL